MFFNLMNFVLILSATILNKQENMLPASLSRWRFLYAIGLEHRLMFGGVTIKTNYEVNKILSNSENSMQILC